LFNGQYSKITWESRYHNVNTILNFVETEMVMVTTGTYETYADHLHIAPIRSSVPARQHWRALHSKCCSCRPANSASNY